jgi:hypothetical protein
LSWHVYRPGARPFSGTCNSTGTAFGRVAASSVAFSGPASNACAPFS